MSQSSSKIYILSAPIRSGKTNSLLEFWEMGNLSFDGFLTPEFDEKRKIIFLDSEEEIEFEADEDSQESTIDIGRFRFKSSAFKKLKTKISRLHQSKAKLIIIDEIGPLELLNQGLEPELSQFIDKFKSMRNEKILLLLVRNTLLDKVIVKYELEDALVLSLDLFKSNFLLE